MKFNSNIYSFFCFSTNSIQTFIQFSFFNKIQFKSWFNFLFPDKIQFNNLFKTLKLAVFNSIKYSFNKKTWVSDRATLSSSAHDCESGINPCHSKKLLSIHNSLDRWLESAAAFGWDLSLLLVELALSRLLCPRSSSRSEFDYLLVSSSRPLPQLIWCQLIVVCSDGWNWGLLHLC